MSGRPLSIGVIGPARFPLVEPFAGGLEAHVHALVRGLRERGHRVTVFAAPGSDPALEAVPLDVDTFASSAAARSDLAAPPERWMREQHAYLALVRNLARSRRRFDVVHDASLHHLPVALADLLEAPVVTCLHTPPVPWLESAARLAGPDHRWVTVSETMARAWRHAVDAAVVPNAVDTEVWRPGPGGPRAVWSGRLVPEKAPHEAVLAARAAGLPIDLCGPRLDDVYFRREVAPLLGDDARHLGHLTQHALREVVSRARVAVVTPAWEEPFGLVAVEAMATGTPVVAYARGALSEVVADGGGRTVPAGDVAALATAMRAVGDDPSARARARRHVVERYSVGSMLDAYETVYRGEAERPQVA